MRRIGFSHVDVFSQSPFGGNSLPVFPDARGLSAEQMLRITQEMRHFEAIFLEPTGQPGTVRARIFDLFDELAFAGHPIIGAAAVLHKQSGADGAQSWRFQLRSKTVEITTTVTAAFNLAADDLAPELPLEVVSTGLRYLIVPVPSSPSCSTSQPSKCGIGTTTESSRTSPPVAPQAPSAPTGYATGWSAVATPSSCIMVNTPAVQAVCACCRKVMPAVSKR
jgi:predicted PhzF superfamily epimerase YddE/YHI9